MENIEKNNSAIGMAESIESKYRVNHVESGLPRWLIEAAFVCYLLQAAINWSPLMHWMDAHAPFASAIIQTFGALVMYFGLMRGMSKRDIQIVVKFLNAVLDEEREEKAMSPKTNEEIIREKYKNLKISPEIQRLRGCMKLTEEEMQDERTKYILGL